MEIFHFKRDIPCMSWSKVTIIISLVTFLLSVFFLTTRGLHLSVEFTGGTLVEVHFEQTLPASHVQDILVEHGFPEPSVQNFGTSADMIIRLALKDGMSSAQLSEDVIATLRAADPGVQLRRVEFIGPQVGEELVHDGLKAMLLVAVGIVAYLTFRFEWRFAVAAIISNFHDLTIVLGFFAFFQWEFSLTVLAAVLSILGYSVNETVVVFDRARENFRKYKKASTAEILNNAITTTMSRTVITHGCTEAAVLSMFFFGGPSLHYFALALTIGIVFGIYSSIFVSCPLVMWMGADRSHFVKTDQPAKSADTRP